MKYVFQSVADIALYIFFIIIDILSRNRLYCIRLSSFEILIDNEKM